jgi:NitT/TauT family transport system ATP-binding protein
MEVDDLLPSVEAAALLSFVASGRGDIELSQAGKAFAEADISTRKVVFREAALAHVTLLQQMHKALASKSDHTIPLELFRDILEERFSDYEVQRQIDTALNWGRYGDIFSYDSESDRLRLYQPATSVDDGWAGP